MFPKPTKKPKTSKAPKPRQRVRQRSTKRVAEDKVRAKVLAKKREENPYCAFGCGRLGTDGHELLSRGQGGSIVDPENIVWICRECHDWIGDNPKLATEAGWRRRRQG